LVLDATNQNLLGQALVQTSFTITAPAPSAVTPTEEATTEEEVAGEEQAPEELVEEVAGEEIPQRNLLADLSVAWGGTGQLTLVIVITSLCLIALAFIGLKEWKVSQKKKKI